MVLHSRMHLLLPILAEWWIKQKERAEGEPGQWDEGDCMTGKRHWEKGAWRPGSVGLFVDRGEMLMRKAGDWETGEETWETGCLVAVPSG